MKRFIFTIKNAEEVIGLTETQKSLSNAIDFFSKIKDLPVHKFLEIYDVKEIPIKKERR